MLLIAMFVLAGGAGFVAWWKFLREPTPIFRIHRDIEYARIGERSLLLDLYLPTDRSVPPPVILWLHGGGWRYGDKNHCPLRFLASEGYAIAAIEYRLTPEAPFPAQIHDCKAAVRWLRAKASEYRIDASRLVAAGESSGGHLALLLGTTADEAAMEGNVGEHKAMPTAVSAVIDFFGSSDLTAYAGAPTDGSDEVFTLLLGGPIAERLELAKQASPITWVSPGDAPVLVLHDEEDTVVPIAQSRKLVEHYQAKNIEVQWHWVATFKPEHNTAPFLDAAGKDRLRAFLRKHLGDARPTGTATGGG